MTYDAARPRYTLTLGGKDYELVGTFELIERIEHAMQQGILQVARRVLDMGLSDTARLLAACTGEDRATLGGILCEVGGVGMQLAQLQLHAFFRIMLSPREKREAEADAMGKLIGELSGSPGETTSASA